MTRQSVHKLHRPKPDKCGSCGSVMLGYRKDITVGLKPVVSGRTAVCKVCGWRRPYDE